MWPAMPLNGFRISWNTNATKASSILTFMSKAICFSRSTMLVAYSPTMKELIMIAKVQKHLAVTSAAPESTGASEGV